MDLTKAAALLCYLFVAVDSSPYNLRKSAIDFQTNNVHEQSSRVNRDISFDLSFFNINARSSFSINNVFNAFGRRKNEQVLSKNQDLKIDDKVLNYTQIQEAKLEKINTDKQKEDSSLPTTDATSVELFLSTETEPTPIGDESLFQRSGLSPAVLSSMLGR